MTPEEVIEIENDHDFLKIKSMLSQSPGYTCAFTRFFFDMDPKIDKKTRYELLEELLQSLKDNKALLSQLPMQVDKYPSIKPTIDDIRPPIERLLDDLDRLKTNAEYNKITKNFTDSLYKVFRDAIKTSSDKVKERVKNIAVALNELESKHGKKINEYFYEGIKDYKGLADLLVAAERHIKSCQNTSYTAFLNRLSSMNKKYGEANGVEVLYNKDGVIVIEIRSFVANQDLNSNTKHCIVRTLAHWETYNKEDLFTKQYYVYNFNISPSDDESVIGVTINPGGEIRAAHDKLDKSCKDEFWNLCKNMGIEDPKSIMGPMTPKEIEMAKIRIEINKKIILPNLTIEDLEKLFFEGGDPNAKSGTPLNNAVREDDLEKLEFLLDKGANANLGNPQRSLKTDSKNGFKILKSLISHGALIDPEVYASLSRNYDAVNFMLENGLDVNSERGMPVRLAAEQGDLEVLKLLLHYGADLSCKRYLALRRAAESYRKNSISIMFEHLADKKYKGFDEKGQFVGECTNMTRSEVIIMMISYSLSKKELTDEQKIDIVNHISKELVRVGYPSENKEIIKFVNFYYKKMLLSSDKDICDKATLIINRIIDLLS